MEVRPAGEILSSEWERAGSDPPAEGSQNPRSDPPAEGSRNPRSDPPAEGSQNPRSDPPAEGSENPRSERAGSDPPAEGSRNPRSDPPAEGSQNPRSDPPAEGSQNPRSDPPAEGSQNPRSERAGSDPPADGSRNLGLESSVSDLPVGSNSSLGSDSLAGGSGSSELNPPAGRRGILGSHPPAGKMQSWVMQQDVQMVSASLKVDPCREAKELTESIEEMLIRLDEFCGMLDMIRNDSSQILDESIPKLKVKALEMKEVYSKIDKMEIFVKMVEQSAAMLEEQVIQAEKDCGSVSRGVCRFLHSINAPFLNKRNCISQQNLAYELPNLYRTEACFPANHNRTFFKQNE
ncbi:swi5-dependent recombination DNA repair protein 1 homolog isoform X2 [Hypanus sabinus]|uniref:swi5-dependent recombination DNA repair protein 1 homolog isoform X2 n=1 Tax=Hypanus sabinus TaxID=79690 RepID=UPI0028C4D538|nr:swi5-dependent recombination DNA repair protein 1 homolog isoform X2 [Hypanus sabinus]